MMVCSSSLPEDPGGGLRTVRRGVVRGRVWPPASKSHSLRALLLAALAGRPCRLERVLEAGDTEVMREVLRRLGWELVPQAAAGRDRTWDLRPPAATVEAAQLDCGASGTTYRLLTAVLAGIPGRWRLSGVRRLRERPIAELVDALRQLGARIAPAADGLLVIEGRRLTGGAVEVDGSRSSQFASALALLGIQCAEGLEVRVRGDASRPYLGITEELITAFGGTFRWIDKDRFRVAGPLPGRPHFAIEADASAACYAAAAAAVAGGAMTIEGLSARSRHGDLRFLHVLEQMGADVTWSADRVRVAGRGRLRACELDCRDLPDQVPTLAAVAATADGSSELWGAAALRLKESDRLAVMARELSRLGVAAEVTPDGLRVRGRAWGGPEPTVAVDVAGDHRIAMSLAILGLVRGAVQFPRDRTVDKSYPGFWDDLAEWTA